MDKIIIYKRDTFHWDIWVDDHRLYKIRGFLGHITTDNQETGHRQISKTVGGAMAFICDELMFERSDAEDSPVIIHGKTCVKVDHVGNGYLHGDKDDTPYNVDGCLYCGRCHRAL